MEVKGEVIEATNIFKALGDETRLCILTALIDDSLTVNEITEKTNVSQSCVSHQLKLLKNLKIVECVRNGKFIYYSIKDNHIVDIINEALEHVQG